MAALHQRQALIQGASTTMKLDNIINMDEEEYLESLRKARASDHMIEQERKLFRLMREQFPDPVEETRRRKAERRSRLVEDEELDPYVKAEIRRISGIAADEVLETLKEGKGV